MDGRQGGRCQLGVPGELAGDLPDRCRDGLFLLGQQRPAQLEFEQRLQQ
ncbi:hypothetical protein ACFQ2B_40475 [Streptomyces stramineus]